VVQHVLCTLGSETEKEREKWKYKGEHGWCTF
jgi:hypothetical protein